MLLRAKRSTGAELYAHFPGLLRRHLTLSLHLENKLVGSRPHRLSLTVNRDGMAGVGPPDGLLVCRAQAVEEELRAVGRETLSINLSSYSSSIV